MAADDIMDERAAQQTERLCGVRNEDPLSVVSNDLEDGEDTESVLSLSACSDSAVSVRT